MQNQNIIIWTTQTKYYHLTIVKRKLGSAFVLHYLLNDFTLQYISNIIHFTSAHKPYAMKRFPKLFERLWVSHTIFGVSVWRGPWHTHTHTHNNSYTVISTHTHAHTDQYVFMLVQTNKMNTYNISLTLSLSLSRATLTHTHHNNSYTVISGVLENKNIRIIIIIIIISLTNVVSQSNVPPYEL